MNGALFVANGVLLFVVARAMLPGGWALLATLLFVTRRAHGQVTLYTSEAQALISTALALAALLLAMRGGGQRRQVAAGALFLGALLAKETAIAVLAIAVAWRRLVDPERRWSLPPGLLWAAAAWAAVLAAARRVVGDEPTGFAYDVSAAMVPRLAAHLFDFSNLLTRGTPHVDMPEPVLRWAFSPAGAGLATALAAAVATALLASRRLALPAAARAAAFGAAWWIAAAAPFLLFADRLFMRYGYFAHAGLAIAVAGAAAWAWDAVRTRRGAATA